MSLRALLPEKLGHDCVPPKKDHLPSPMFCALSTCLQKHSTTTYAPQSLCQELDCARACFSAKAEYKTIHSPSLLVLTHCAFQAQKNRLRRTRWHQKVVSLATMSVASLFENDKRTRHVCRALCAGKYWTVKACNANARMPSRGFASEGLRLKQGSVCRMEHSETIKCRDLCFVARKVVQKRNFVRGMESRSGHVMI